MNFSDINIDNYFDKIFYINLDNDVEKNNQIISQFQKYSITNYERVSGTILTEIPDKAYWRNFNIQQLSEKYVLGSLGCRNSHWRITQMAMERGYEKILVFEDDVIFQTDPNELLRANLDNLQDWDMLYFGGIEEHHFGGQIVTTHAYAINKKLIEETYYMLPTSGMEVDNFYAKILFHISYNYRPEGKYLIKKIYPFNTIVQNKLYQSNIQL